MSANSTTSNSTTFPPQYETDIKLTFAVSGTVSFVASSLFLIYVVVQTFRKRAFFKYMSLRLLSYIELSALLASISDIFSFGLIQGEPRALCQAQGFLSQFFSLAVALWTLCLSFFMFLTIVMGVKSRKLYVVQLFTYTSRLEIIFHVFVWVVTIVASGLPWIGDTYGYSGYWCYIKRSVPIGRLWILVVYYVPIWIVIVLVIALYIAVVVFMLITQRRNRFSVNRKIALTAYYKLVAYPVVFLIAWVFPTINRGIGLAQADISVEALYALGLIHALSARAQGTLNVIVYALAPIDTSNLLLLQLRMLLTRCGILRGEADKEVVIMNDLTEIMLDDAKTDLEDFDWNAQTEPDEVSYNERAV